MSTKTKLIVGLVALAAVGLLMVLLYLPMLRHPATLRAAVTSPLAVASMSLLLACLLVLGLLCLYLKRCTDRPHTPLHKFFSDEGGTAAFEMLLGLPFILCILELMLQCALLWNANMVVHYAGFAATRAAITTVQSNVPGSQANPPSDELPFVDEPNYLVANPNAPAPEGSSLKLWRIHRAAAIALAPVSDEYPTSECDDADFNTSDVPDLLANGITSAIQSAGTSSPNQPWPNHVAAKYSYAWANSTITLALPYHWQNGNPNGSCPYVTYQAGTTWNSATDSFNQVPYCLGYNWEYLSSQLMWDYAWNEPLTVTLTYFIPMQIPYANAALNKLGIGEPYVIPGSGENSYKVLVTVVTQL